MLSDAQTRALRAAARLTFTLSAAAACGGGGEATYSTVQAPSGGAVAVAPQAPAEQTAYAVPAIQAADPVTSPASDDAFARCVAHEEQVFGAGAAASDPTTGACCSAIIDRIDHHPASSDASQWSADYAKASSVLSQCCGVAHYPHGVACTPWGPPPPPAMAARAEEVA